MTIQVIPFTGALIGNYTNYASPSDHFPIVGWVNSAKSNEGDVVHVLTFAVRWWKYDSLTAWTGYCEEKSGEPTLTTLWHYVRSASNYPWDHIITNSDVFTPKKE
ncbi:Avidin/streptavidin [Rhizophagus diaphanus]|nr:Avidin/streptavidin [Rhizophagus diaphanus] [Rhizophagus sp. MUCL 43196]